MRFGAAVFVVEARVLFVLAGWRSDALVWITPSGRQGEMAVSRLERVACPPLSLGLGVGWWQRVHLALIAWWRAGLLDRRLAAGASPRGGPVLALRAQTLTARRSRERVADGLARAIHDARAGTPGFSAAVRPHREELLAASIVIGTLERRLRAAEPVSARGVALLRVLLSDGASSLYRPCARGALGSELRAAAAALEPDRRSDRSSAGSELGQPL